MASAGSGGTRLSQAIRLVTSAGPRRLSSTLPTPKLTGETSVRTKAPGENSPPTLRPISARPASATAEPAHCIGVGRSPSASAAKTIVNSACVCTITDASPGGMPCAIPKNWNRNWPANSVRPTGTSADHGRAGRGSSSAGAAAIRKRSATSCGGEKASRPMRVATKATPQMTATRTARPASRARRGSALEGAGRESPDEVALQVGEQDGHRDGGDDDAGVPDRLFTPDEANSALAEVRPVAERLVALRERMRELERTQGELVTAIGGNGGGYAAGDLNVAQQELIGLAEADAGLKTSASYTVARAVDDWAAEALDGLARGTARPSAL